MRVQLPRFFRLFLWEFLLLFVGISVYECALEGVSYLPMQQVREYGLQDFVGGDFGGDFADCVSVVAVHSCVRSANATSSSEKSSSNSRSIIAFDKQIFCFYFGIIRKKRTFVSYFDKTECCTEGWVSGLNQQFAKLPIS